jgi:hypothetical protein
MILEMKILVLLKKILVEYWKKCPKEGFALSFFSKEYSIHKLKIISWKVVFNKTTLQNETGVPVLQKSQEFPTSMNPNLIRN